MTCFSHSAIYCSILYITTFKYTNLRMKTPPHGSFGKLTITLPSDDKVAGAETSGHEVLRVSDDSQHQAHTDGGQSHFEMNKRRGILKLLPMVWRLYLKQLMSAETNLTVKLNKKMDKRNQENQQNLKGRLNLFLLRLLLYWGRHYARAWVSIIHIKTTGPLMMLNMLNAYRSKHDNVAKDNGSQEDLLTCFEQHSRRELEQTADAWRGRLSSEEKIGFNSRQVLRFAVAGMLLRPF